MIHLLSIVTLVMAYNYVSMEYVSDDSCDDPTGLKIYDPVDTCVEAYGTSGEIVYHQTWTCTETRATAVYYDNDSSCSGIQAFNRSVEFGCEAGLYEISCVDSIPTYYPKREWYDTDSSCSEDILTTWLYSEGACVERYNDTSAKLSCGFNGSMEYIKWYNPNCDGTGTVEFEESSSFCFDYDLDYGYWNFACPTFDSEGNYILKTLYSDDECSSAALYLSMTPGSCIPDFSVGLYSKIWCPDGSDDVFVEYFEDEECLFKEGEMLTDGSCSDGVVLECSTGEPSFDIVNVDVYTTEDCSSSSEEVFTFGAEEDVCFSALPTEDDADDELSMKFRCLYSDITKYLVVYQYRNTSECVGNNLQSLVTGEDEDITFLTTMSGQCTPISDDSYLSTNDSTYFIDPYCPDPSGDDWFDAYAYVTITQYVVYSSDDTCDEKTGSFTFPTQTCVQYLFSDEEVPEYAKFDCTDGGVVVQLFNSSTCDYWVGGLIIDVDVCGGPGEGLKFSCSNTVPSASIEVYGGDDTTCSADDPLAYFSPAFGACVDRDHFFNFDGLDYDVSHGYDYFYSSNGAWFWIKEFNSSDCSASYEMRAYPDGTCASLGFGEDESDDSSFWDSLRYNFECAEVDAEDLPAAKDYAVTEVFLDGSEESTYYFLYEVGVCTFNHLETRYQVVECGEDQALVNIYGEDDTCSTVSYEESLLFEFGVYDAGTTFSCSGDYEGEILGGIEVIPSTLYEEVCDEESQSFGAEVFLKEGVCVQNLLGASSQFECRYTYAETAFVTVSSWSVSSTCEDDPDYVQASKDEECFDLVLPDLVLPDEGYDGDFRRSDDDYEEYQSLICSCPSPTEDEEIAEEYDIAYIGFIYGGNCLSYPDFAIGYEPETCVPFGDLQDPESYVKLFCLGEDEMIAQFFEDDECVSLEDTITVVFKDGACVTVEDSSFFSSSTLMTGGCFNGELHEDMIMVEIYENEECGAEEFERLHLYKPGVCISDGIDGQGELSVMCVDDTFYFARWESGEDGCGGSPDDAKSLNSQQCATFEVEEGVEKNVIGSCVDQPWDPEEDGDFGDDEEELSWWVGIGNSFVKKTLNSDSSCEQTALYLSFELEACISDMTLYGVYAKYSSVDGDSVLVEYYEDKDCQTSVGEATTITEGECNDGVLLELFQTDPLEGIDASAVIYSELYPATEDCSPEDRIVRVYMEEDTCFSHNASEEVFSDTLSCFYSANGAWLLIKDFDDEGCLTNEDIRAYENGTCTTVTFGDDSAFWGGYVYQFVCPVEEHPTSKLYAVTEIYLDGSDDSIFYLAWETNTCTYNEMESQYQMVECGETQALVNLYGRDGTCSYASYEESLLIDLDEVITDAYEIDFTLMCTNVLDEVISGDDFFDVTMYGDECDAGVQPFELDAFMNHGTCIPNILGESSEFECRYSSRSTFITISSWSDSDDCDDDPDTMMAFEDGQCINLDIEGDEGPKAMVSSCPEPTDDERAREFDIAYLGLIFDHEGEGCLSLPDVGMGFRPEQCVQLDSGESSAKLFCLGEDEMVALFFDDDECQVFSYSTYFVDGECLLSLGEEAEDEDSDTILYTGGCFNGELDEDFIEIVVYVEDSTECGDEDFDHVLMFKPGACINNDFAEETESEMISLICQNDEISVASWDGQDCEGGYDEVEMFSVDTCQEMGVLGHRKVMISCVEEEDGWWEEEEEDDDICDPDTDEDCEDKEESSCVYIHFSSVLY